MIGDHRVDWDLVARNFPPFGASYITHRDTAAREVICIESARGLFDFSVLYAAS